MIMRRILQFANLSSMKNYNNFQFILSISFGWFILGHLWHAQMTTILNSKDVSLSIASQHLHQCVCESVQCPPCSKVPFDQAATDKINLNIAKSYYRSYRYKPMSAVEDETNRWRHLTKKHNYEMINQEPRVGINGMWKVEVDKVDQQGQALVKQYDSANQGSTGSLDMQDIFRHIDPFHGMKYVVNYVERDKTDTTSHSSVEMWRPFIGGKPKLIDIEHASDKEMINIISPLSKVSERFNMFLHRYKTNVLRGSHASSVRIIFVIFKPSDGEMGEKDESVHHIVSVLDQFKMQNPRALFKYVFTTGEFNRAVGLHTGVMQCKDDEIVLFLDVDLKIGPDFLGRVRRNTILNKRVIFPIMFSQYDPEILEKASEVDSDIHRFVKHKMQINKQTGFWIYYAFGVAAMYKADYLKVGGFRLDIRGWGGEDVDLFKKMVVDPELDVMSMVDPDLIHIYHKRGCDVTLAPDQYAMCIGAWSETLGSQLEVATLYLHSHQGNDL